MIDEETFDFVYDSCLAWQKLFIEAQDVLRLIRRQELLPDDVYIRACRICEIEELPKRYLKKGKGRRK